MRRSTNGVSIRFWKYHGCGNDFVVIDGRDALPCLSPSAVPSLCHRQYGIGADGVLIIGRSGVADCKMTLYNADGSEAEMCGNGLRCLAAHLYFHDETPHATVESLDGIHTVDIAPTAAPQTVTATATVGAADTPISVLSIATPSGAVDLYSLDTGVPHAILFVDDVNAVDTFETMGRTIRQHPTFHPAGTNVNIVSIVDDTTLAIRTYERGVEAETFACGTGATAAALVAYRQYGMASRLRVTFASSHHTLTIQVPSTVSAPLSMTGPATRVFAGETLSPFLEESRRSSQDRQREVLLQH